MESTASKSAVCTSANSALYLALACLLAMYAAFAAASTAAAAPLVLAASVLPSPPRSALFRRTAPRPRALRTMARLPLCGTIRAPVRTHVYNAGIPGIVHPEWKAPGKASV